MLITETRIDLKCRYARLQQYDKKDSEKGTRVQERERESEYSNGL